MHKKAVKGMGGGRHRTYRKQSAKWQRPFLPSKLNINGSNCLPETQKPAERVKSGLPYAVDKILILDPKTQNDREGRIMTFYAQSNQHRAGLPD